VQFSTPLNIALSQASLELMRPWAHELGFVEGGYLYLARADQAALLRQLHTVQRAAGAQVLLLEPDELAARWPWLALSDIALGSWGERGEGWFDGPALHQRLKREAVALGARFVAAEAIGFETHGAQVRGVRDEAGRVHRGDAVLLAAGAWSAPLGAQLGFVLPVSAKKRDVFVLDAPVALPGCPLLIDPAGAWLRPEGRGFLAGGPPRAIDGVTDPDGAPLDAIDFALFDDWLWPVLAARIPAFEALRVRSAWAGYYEVNRFDHNGLVGALPGWDNTFVCCGFSGHGMQHALAVGRGLASWMAGEHWGAIDLSPLSPQRLQRGEPLRELNVI
jgi:glycine/D-amino acid oxidase-like deaminating enzyme